MKNSLRHFKPFRYTAGMLLVAVAGFGCRPDVAGLLVWHRAPDLPGAGVSAPFVGVHAGKQLVAGGCNFPGIPASEGGNKVYYDRIYIRKTGSAGSSAWQEAGRLPEPIAYGASVSVREGVVCIGGNNAERSRNEVFLLHWSDSAQQVLFRNLPALPVTLDNAGAATIGRRVYVAGGQAAGLPSRSIYGLDLDDLAAGWRALPPFPEPSRVQPVVSAQRTPAGYRIFVAGGYRPAANGLEAVVSTDLLAYDPDTEAWNVVCGILPFEDGEPRTVSGGCGTAYGDSCLLFAGGVNYTVFLDALRREQQKKEAQRTGDSDLVEKLTREHTAYMERPVAWYRFNTALLTYNTYTGEWCNRGDSEQSARAGAGLILDGKRLVIVNGELKPGIRTPEVNEIELPF